MHIKSLQQLVTNLSYQTAVSKSFFSAYVVSHLRTPADSSVEPSERHALFEASDILQVLEGSPQGHLLDSLSRFSCVL